VTTITGFSLFGLDIPASITLIGLVTGATYGVLAVGLVLVYRATRIVNFAHGEIGAFAAAVLGVLVVQHGWWYWLAFPVALLLGAGTGALTEVAVVRRLRSAPRLMSMVATLGAAEILLGLEGVASAQARTGSLYPQPPGFPSFLIGRLSITPAYTAMLVLSPIAVLLITLFLRRSRYGLAIRAAAANPDAARLAAVSVTRMSTLSWAIAGALSAFTAILIFPTQSFLSAEAFGPDLMLRALTAAVIARMNSLPWALVAGLGVGFVEAILFWNFPSNGYVEPVLFVLIVLALVVQPAVAGRRDDRGSWATVQGWRPVHEALRQVWVVRHLGALVGAVALAVALLLPALISFGASFQLAEIFALAVAGISIFLVTGLAGQLSLGQLALGGIGAWVAYVAVQDTGNYIVAVFAGGLAAAAASIIVGVPALRIRGLMLAVTTLAFALMASSWLLQQPWALGSGVEPGVPVIGGAVLSSSKAYYYFALAFLVLATWIAANVRRGGLGRVFIAIRDNEDAARAFTVNIWGRKLQAFGLGGFLAGIGGAVYGFALSRIGANTFLPSLSIDVVAMTVIGGIGILGGPILGAFYIFGVPDFVPLDAVTTAATAAGWLLLILYFPGGIAGLLAPQRDRLVRALVRLSGRDPDALIRDSEAPVRGAVAEIPAATTLPPATVVAPPGGNGAHTPPLLEVTDVRKAFGGITAVAGVSVTVNRGEILGLIGPNGAGKTTLFELIAGFTRPDAGSITFDGHSLTRSLPVAGRMRVQLSVPAYLRARRGLVRSFQDAALFPTMSVLETVMLAQEGIVPTTLFAAAVGSREQDRPKRERARELIAAMGLERYTHTPVQELSTGTRRITELCCMVVLRPRLLLLDEPSSGIAQRESEALGPLLRGIREQLDATLIVIEHDIPLVMGISDRIAAMESGRIIRVGSPAEVRDDPQVIESYLGTGSAALERSGTAPATA
jgi:ABC-type branched-subunit amino acid transport system ATPase component/ABC-type branched-subunit amino acid transport system permease subunit